MDTAILNQKETNQHLMETGAQLEREKMDNRQAFILHQMEDGREFYKPSPDDDWESLLKAKADEIHAFTLSAVETYLRDNPDALDLTKVMVCVVSPTGVKVCSNLFGGWKQRETFLHVSALLPEHMFNMRVAPDEFTPYLQSCFCPSEDLSALLAVSGNIVDTTEVHALDDGVSQTATVRQGAARKSEIQVPSPAILYPFSTFAEVEQPARKFVFRLSSSPLGCTLKECDGGAWRITAVNSIAEWLKKRLPEGVKVIA